MSPIEIVQERIKELEEKTIPIREARINEIQKKLASSPSYSEKNFFESSIKEENYWLYQNKRLLKMNKEILHYILTGERRVLNG